MTSAAGDCEMAASPDVTINTLENDMTHPSAVQSSLSASPPTVSSVQPVSLSASSPVHTDVQSPVRTCTKIERVTAPVGEDSVMKAHLEQKQPTPEQLSPPPPNSMPCLIPQTPPSSADVITDNKRVLESQAMEQDNVALAALGHVTSANVVTLKTSESSQRAQAMTDDTSATVAVKDSAATTRRQRIQDRVKEYVNLVENATDELHGFLRSTLRDDRTDGVANDDMRFYDQVILKSTMVLCEMKLLYENYAGTSSDAVSLLPVHKLEARSLDGVTSSHADADVMVIKHEPTNHTRASNELDYRSDATESYDAEMSGADSGADDDLSTTNAHAKSYVCSICAASFATSIAMRAHVRHEHTTLCAVNDSRKEWHCGKCDSRKFATRKKLRVHMIDAHGLRTRKHGDWVCPQCSRTYANAHSLRAHLRYKHKLIDVQEADSATADAHHLGYQNQLTEKQNTSVDTQNVREDDTRENSEFSNPASHDLIAKLIALRGGQAPDALRGGQAPDAGKPRKRKAAIAAELATRSSSQDDDKPPWPCGSCSEEFSSRDALVEHLSSNLACDKSPVKLRNRLRRGNVTAKRERTWSCKQCSSVFDSRSELVKHTKSTHKHKKATRLKLATTSTSVKAASARASGAGSTRASGAGSTRASGVATTAHRYKCDICEMVFSHKQTCLRHERSHVFTMTQQRVGDSFLCDECQTLLMDAEKLYFHNKRFHRDKFAPSQTYAEKAVKTGCSDDVKQRPDTQALTDVVDKHHDAPGDGASADAKQEDAKEVDAKQEDAKSRDVDMQDDSVNNELVDMLNETADICAEDGGVGTVGGAEPCVCHICAKVYGSRKLLSYHLRSHRLKELECSVCSRVLKGARNMKIHMRRHTGETPYSCDLCDAKFRSRVAVRSHMYRQHIGKKTYQCDQCAQSYCWKSSLEWHKLKVHSVTKNIHCQVCFKGFVFQSELDKHMGCHATERTECCDQCDARFTTKDGLRSHRNQRHSTQTIPCEICGKIFAHISRLRQHMISHSDARPYACDVCSACFKKKHMLTEHKRTHTGEKPFLCPHCPARFLCSSNLSKHKKKHRNEAAPAAAAVTSPTQAPPTVTTAMTAIATNSQPAAVTVSSGSGGGYPYECITPTPTTGASGSGGVHPHKSLTPTAGGSHSGDVYQHGSLTRTSTVTSVDGRGVYTHEGPTQMSTAGAGVPAAMARMQDLRAAAAVELSRHPNIPVFPPGFETQIPYYY